MEVCQKFYKKYGELPYHAGFDFKVIVTISCTYIVDIFMLYCIASLL